MWYEGSSMQIGVWMQIIVQQPAAETKLQTARPYLNYFYWIRKIGKFNSDLNLVKGAN